MVKQSRISLKILTVEVRPLRNEHLKNLHCFLRMEANSLPTYVTMMNFIA